MPYGIRDGFSGLCPRRRAMPPNRGVKTSRVSLSCRLHSVVFRDTHESLCSRAYRLRHRSKFWRAWVVAFGERHCESSWRFYHD